MIVTIPTINRVDRQPTYDVLKQVANPVLICPPEEVDAHTARGRKAIGVSAKGIAATRQYIVDNMGAQVAMFDDDLDFAARRVDDRTKFRPATLTDVRDMLDLMRRLLDDYPMVGVSHREGANRQTEPTLFNTRILRVMAFDTAYLKSKGISFLPLPVMEDFHVTLSILKTGSRIVTCNDWVHNQSRGSGSAGGCSTYRTMEVQRQGAEALKALHSDFVTVVEKAPNSAWGGMPRTDVTIQWKKAYEWGVRNA
jgi:hypothetical protein